jgi:hypothetical protein
MLSKEVLSVASISIMIYSLRKRSRSALAAALLVALLTRFILFVGMVVVLAHLRLTKSRIFRFFGFLVMIILIVVFIQYFGILRFEAKSNLEAILLTLIGPVDFMRTVIMAIPRTAVWLLSPLPLIDIGKVGEIWSSDPYLFWQAFLYISRVLSSLLILAVVFAEIIRYFTNRTVRNDVYIFGLLMLFSSLAFLEGARYRCVLEPFIVLRFLTSNIYANSIFIRGVR